MANRKRGTFFLPEELRTNERLSTKKEMAQRKSLPLCPPVPNKIRKSLLSASGIDEKPRPVCFNKSVGLSPAYDPSIDRSYFEQLYSRQKMIGEGSFGKVYRARSREDNNIYAIKRLKSVISFKNRYAEVRNNEKVGFHPNCVQFFMAWEEAHEVYMLLEHCDMSLFDFSVLNNDIPEEVLWNVLYDICKALFFLHSKDLLHLDVKPGNIMIKNGHFKLTDFGILVDLKLPPMVCKTLSDGDSKYLALEVLEGIYKPSCDIFGLGISLLEVAADLELPSYGPLWQQLRHEILPQIFYQRVSLGFTVIIERMLKPEYNARPSAEKILKFSSVKAIEKRDKKSPRIDYAAPLVDNDNNNNEDEPPLPDAINNNIISTPPCALDANSVDIPNYIEIRAPSSEEASNRFDLCGRKSLFCTAEEAAKNMDQTITLNEMNDLIEASLGPLPESPNLSVPVLTDSTLAVELTNTNNSVQMDVDNENANECSEIEDSEKEGSEKEDSEKDSEKEDSEKEDSENEDSEKDAWEYMSDDEGLLTSTPILKKKHRKTKLFLPKTKLAF